MNRQPSGAQREQLLAAASALAQGAPPVGLTAKRICTAAQCTPGVFRRHFRDPTDYLLAVQQAFMNAVRDRIVEELGPLPEGYERVRKASETYLDACLEQQALRSWLLQARKQYPPLADALRRQNEVYHLMLAGEFKKLGWAHPSPAARLFIAMLMETGTMETLAGKAVPDMRATLWDYLRAYS